MVRVYEAPDFMNLSHWSLKVLTFPKLKPLCYDRSCFIESFSNFDVAERCD